MLKTGIGKQLYRSIVDTSDIDNPAISRAASLASTAAGLRLRSGRRNSGGSCRSA